METKMHCKSCFSGHCNMRGLNEDTGNTWPPLYMSKTLNEHNYDGCFRSPLSGSEYDKEMLKQTILEHEAIFRKQVYDLHRLYSIQKDLMEELQKNGFFRFSTLKAPSKSVSYSSQVQSECSIRMLQMFHLHAVKSHTESKKARYMDDNVSSVSFFESNLQPSSASLENKAQKRFAEPDAIFRKCTKRMFDLRLPASVYVDDTDRSEEGIPHSSSLNTIPCFRICNGNPENKEKSNLASLSGCNGREEASNLNSPPNKSLFNSWADLNEPKKRTSLEKSPDSFPPLLLEPRIQAEENHGHNFCSLSSTNLCLQGAFPKDGDFDGRAFSNLLQVKEEISQRGPLCNNEAAGECCPMSFTSSISHKAKYHMFVEPLELKVNKVSSIISNDCKSKWFGHEQDFQISIKSPGYLESENSGKNTSLFPNSFSSPPKLEINASSLSLVPTWRKPSSDRSHVLSPFPSISSFNGTKKVKMFCSSDTAAEDLNGVSGRWQVGNSLRSPLGLENKTPSHLNDLNHGFQLQSNSKSQLNFPFTNINLNLKAESSFSGTQDELTVQMNKEICIIDGKCEDFLLVPSWLQRKLASESLDKSRFPSQVDIGFSMDQGNERKTEDETGLHSSNLEVSSSILHARESERHCNQLSYSFGEKLVGFANFDMIQQNAASVTNQEKSDELKNASISYGIKPYRSKEYRRSNCRKYIDLNSRFPFLDDPDSSEMPAEGHADVPSINLGQISVSRVELEAPVMTPQEDNIPSHVECTPSSNRDGLQQELCSPEMFMKEAAESIMKLSLHGLKHMGGILCCPAKTSPSNALHCFAEIILSKNESVQMNSVGDCHFEPPNDELDIFELMTLQLEEMKPEELWRRPQEAQNMNVDEKSRASLLTRPRRGQGKKRRQRKEFQKDILPGLSTLSRQEVIKDLQTIGELLKASGSPWPVGPRRRNTYRNCSQTRQLRNASASITVVRIKTPILPDNPEFDLGRQHMIMWGRKTRRCQSQRCPTSSISAALI